MAEKRRVQTGAKDGRDDEGEHLVVIGGPEEEIDDEVEEEEGGKEVPVEAIL